MMANRHTYLYDLRTYLQDAIYKIENDQHHKLLIYLAHQNAVLLGNANGVYFIFEGKWYPTKPPTQQKSTKLHASLYEEVHDTIHS